MPGLACNFKCTLQAKLAKLRRELLEPSAGAGAGGGGKGEGINTVHRSACFLCPYVYYSAAFIVNGLDAFFFAELSQSTHPTRVYCDKATHVGTYSLTFRF